MEDKIEVGEYVRTIDGKFGIFDRYSTRKDDSLYKSPFNCFIKLQNRKTCLQCCRDYIVNHSKNLIEVGDYVNGHLVVAVYLEGANKYIKLDNSYSIENDFSGVRIYAEDIKSIVTKEQFESVEYKV